MSYATPDDVAQELGRPTSSVTPEQQAQWQRWLDRVERDIAKGFRRAGLDLAAAVVAGDPTSEEVADVEVAAVVRKVQNPTWGRTSVTRQVDDGSVTYRNESGLKVDPLDLLEDDIADLLPDGVEADNAGAYSVRPTFEPDNCHHIPGGW